MWGIVSFISDGSYHNLHLDKRNQLHTFFVYTLNYLMELRIWAIFMKRTIVCVKGSSQTGKTPSIRELYALVASEAEKTENADFKIPGHDISCKTKYKDVLIGFYSWGDPGCAQYEEISKHIQDGCEIIICSCRNWGQTKNDIERVANEFGFDLIYTSTYHSPMVSQDFMRQHFVAALLNLLDSCIFTH